MTFRVQFHRRLPCPRAGVHHRFGHVVVDAATHYHSVRSITIRGVASYWGGLRTWRFSETSPTVVGPSAPTCARTAAQPTTLGSTFQLGKNLAGATVAMWSRCARLRGKARMYAGSGNDCAVCVDRTRFRSRGLSYLWSRRCANALRQRTLSFRLDFGGAEQNMFLD